MTLFEVKPLHMAVANERVIGITIRHGGSSPYPADTMNMAHYIDDETANIVSNQARLAEVIRFPRRHWVFPIQTHGNHIAEVTDHHKGMNIDKITGDLHGYDGLWTKQEDILLTMCFADCVPVYLYSKIDQYIALGHAGWRGTLGMVTGQLIKAYDHPEALVCIIGPSICSDCYEVNQDIRDQFDQLPFNTEEFFELKENGCYKINLKALNREIAIYHGVKPENIKVSSECTAEHPDFFSYRKENGKTGRMLAFIGTRNDHDS
ncbi:peptidoglycan editing factor PgeF [Macrococcus lamae]|uniref:peptidoglycan editing factor PgeF n=1 Tax=Macrococcus lamae TaxID=198484 RepID=UPI001407DC5D|nr:peptidoglycan editing factor PgeF [Macrococcus lamae]